MASSRGLPEVDRRSIDELSNRVDDLVREFYDDINSNEFVRNYQQPLVGVADEKKDGSYVTDRYDDEEMILVPDYYLNEKPLIAPAKARRTKDKTHPASSKKATTSNRSKRRQSFEPTEDSRKPRADLRSYPTAPRSDYDRGPYVSYYYPEISSPPLRKNPVVVPMPTNHHQDDEEEINYFSGKADEKDQLVVLEQAPEKEKEKEDDANDVGNGDGDDEDKPLLLPDGYEMNDLGEDIYTLIFTGNPKGVGFWFGMAIFTFQSSILVLLMQNTVDFNNPNNPLKMPAGNSWAVVATQALIFFVLPQLSDDMMEGLELLIDGYHPEVLDTCPHASMWSWALSGFLHFAIGALGMCLAFFLILQQTTVIGIGYKYVGVAFFTKIDNIAFAIAKKGVCSMPLQKEIKAAGEVKVRGITRYTWSRRFRDTVLFLGLFIGWAILTYRMSQGWYLCTQIFVQFGDVFNPEIVEYSGMYDALATKDKVAYRYVYQDRETGTTRLGYCNDKKHWTLSYFTDDGSWDPCQEVIANSGTDEGYDILKTKDSWKVNRPIKGDYKPFTHFSMSCNKCDEKCKSSGGSCDEDNNCVCKTGHFGVNCEYETPCTSFAVNKHTKPFPNQQLGFVRIPEEWEMLTLEDGSVGAESHLGTFQVEYRPVFFGEKGLNQFLMFYAGRRWVITEAVLDSVFLSSKSEVVDYMSDPDKFNIIQSTYRPYFTSAPMDSDTPSNAATPNHLQWFRVRTNIGDDDGAGDDQFGSWWDPAEDEPVETVLLCTFCDKFENPCENWGTCNLKEGPQDSPEHGVCECEPGTTGALCEYEIQCTDLQEDDASKRKGCVYETATCMPSGKCENCPVGTFGSRCQLDFPCSHAADYFSGLSGSIEIIGDDFAGCFHGGSCLMSDACECPDPYFGQLCQFGDDNSTLIEDMQPYWPF